MRYEDGLHEQLDPLWSDELGPIEVQGDHGSAVLTVRTVVTAVNGVDFHAALALQGELCAASAPSLRAAVERLVGFGVVDVSFDLADLRLCTSAGIDVWMDLAAQLEPVGGDLRLRNARGGVRRVLDVVGLADRV